MGQPRPRPLPDPKRATKNQVIAALRELKERERYAREATS